MAISVKPVLISEKQMEAIKKSNRVLILVVFWLASVRKMRMRQRQATLTQRLV
ncbi:hypothetical protein [Escherichia coli]|uniref:hypothetical protein n=1 Tax=Escherichia coli TaxID=562 RepID=UPI001FCEFD48|nr:hypothetical protein [Escherichia coli]